MGRRLLEKIEDANTIAIFCIVVFFTSAMAMPKKRSFKQLLCNLFFSAPLGVLSGLVALDYGYPDTVAIGLAVIVTAIIQPFFVAILGDEGFLNKELRRGFKQLIDKYTK